MNFADRTSNVKPQTSNKIFRYENRSILRKHARCNDGKNAGKIGGYCCSSCNGCSWLHWYIATFLNW